TPTSMSRTRRTHPTHIRPTIVARSCKHTFETATIAFTTAWSGRASAYSRISSHPRRSSFGPSNVWRFTRNSTTMDFGWTSTMRHPSVPAAVG
ncbi:hypothetical protein LTR33_012616, partial [Friedmanniomyces endolithicus]